MRPANGKVMVNETPGKSKLYRFCEKKIDQWLESHSMDPHLPTEFRVSFTHEENETEESKQISCVTEIHLGDTVLRGCDVDVDTQAAFLHSLKRLHAAQATI